MNKKYYIVSSSSDPKLIGSDFPQAYNFTKEYNPNAPHALFDLYECLYTQKFPDYIPDLSGIRMSGKAKLTDIVSNGFGGQLEIVSPRTKEILETYNLCPHRFYEMNLYLRKVKYDYYMFHTQCDYSDLVDYKKSTFVEYYNYSTKGAPMPINSKEEFLIQKGIVEEKNILNTVTVDTLFMTPNFWYMNLDYFYISLVDTGEDYISERLMKHLLESKITGWDFIPATNLMVE